MAKSFSVPTVVFDKFPIPVQAFIGGKYVDSTGNDRHILVSAVNDAVVTSELQWSNARDVDYAVDVAEEGLKLWQAMSDVSTLLT